MRRLPHTLLLAAILPVILTAGSRSQGPGAEELSSLRQRIQRNFGVELPAFPVPVNNPQSSRKIQLGERLFFDPNLSSCGNVACATCHLPETGFSDGEEVSDGCAGATGRRNSNSVYNSAYMSHMFWDGRVQTLEEQALGPVVDPAEMANTWDNVLEYLKTGHHKPTGKSFPQAKAIYQSDFQEVFNGHIDSTTVSKAIAAYERTAVSSDSPYDRWLKGDEGALSTAQKRGLLVFFGRARCANCHIPPNFSDSDFHNVGAPNAGFETAKQFPHNSEICGGLPAAADPGRAEVPFLRSSCSDVGRFKTPSLRNVSLSGPYMHNGGLESLEEVVRHYEALAKGFATAVVGELDVELKGVRLGDGGGKPTDIADLVAFLEALSGSQLKSPPGGISPPR